MRAEAGAAGTAFIAHLSLLAPALRLYLLINHDAADFPKGVGDEQDQANVATSWVYTVIGTGMNQTIAAATILSRVVAELNISPCLFLPALRVFTLRHLLEKRSIAKEESMHA